MMRRILLALAVILIIFTYWQHNKDCCMCGDTDNTCCPCPNTKYQVEIEAYMNQTASSAGSWKYMCEEYKTAYNKTFECFK